MSHKTFAKKERKEVSAELCAALKWEAVREQGETSRIALRLGRVEPTPRRLPPRASTRDSSADSM